MKLFSWTCLVSSVNKGNWYFQIKWRKRWNIISLLFFFYISIQLSLNQTAELYISIIWGSSNNLALFGSFLNCGLVGLILKTTLPAWWDNIGNYIENASSMLTILHAFAHNLGLGNIIKRFCLYFTQLNFFQYWKKYIW